MSENPRLKIAKRTSKEFNDGDIINLGVGIPTLIADFVVDKNVYLHSENGLLGIGKTPDKENINMNLISASKKPITMKLGASLFDSVDSFAMIRGGHIDVAVLGILQIDQYGQIANWSIPGQHILGVGGAMDLLTGAKKIIATSLLQNRAGEPKLVKELTYPESSYRKAELLVTEHAVFEFLEDGVHLKEIISDITLEELQSITNVDIKNIN